MARIEKVLAGDETWGAYALDVAGHAALGVLYSLPLEVLALWFGWGYGWALGLGEIAAVAGGVIREVLQYLKNRKLHLLDRALDAAHHVLGPPIALGLAFGILALIR
jgi:hypothetical protein